MRRASTGVERITGRTFAVRHGRTSCRLCGPDVLIDTAQMDTAGPAEHFLTALGERHDRPATIGRACSALDNSVTFQPIDESGDSAGCDRENVGEIRRAKLSSVGLRQHQQHGVPIERQAGLVFHLKGEQVVNLREGRARL